MKYRTEIDGLRAIAVIPVILFHAGFELFSGGFVGVDVFFVISGYLITTILIEDIENKRFSIAEFYERRARRILPALFGMLLTVSAIAVITLPKDHLVALFESVLATNLFFSNIHFWQNSGYFEQNSLTNPLLHTWSLAVEEQYYFFFPVLLIIIWGFGKNRAFWVVFLMAAVSLVISEWGWRNSAAANFYLLPTRAWELFSGSISAFVIQRKGVQKNNALALLGLSAIVFSIFAYDEKTPFPSVYALVPVLGVILLLLFAARDTLAAQLLSTKAFVAVGLISYSAYLWHQPLLAYARIIYLNDQLSGFLLLVVISSTMILSVLSWKFIEQPFRKNNLTIGRVNKIAMLLIVFCFTTVVSYLGKENPPVMIWNSISSNADMQFDVKKVTDNSAFKHIGLTKTSDFNHASVFKKNDSSKNCKFLIIGDSHAGHLAQGFSNNIAEKTGCEVHVNTSLGCTPLFGFYKIYNIDQKIEPARQAACRNQVKVWEKFVFEKGSDYRLIIFSSRWNWLISDSIYGGKSIRKDALLPIDAKYSRAINLEQSDRFNNVVQAIKRTAQTLKAANAKGLFMSQPPVQLLDMRDFGSIRAYQKAAPSKSIAEKRNSLFHEAFLQSSVSDAKSVFFIDTFNHFFCPDQSSNCKNRIGYKSFYNDNDHLSDFGSYKLSEFLLENNYELLLGQ